MQTSDSLAVTTYSERPALSPNGLSRLFVTCAVYHRIPQAAPIVRSLIDRTA